MKIQLKQNKIGALILGVIFMSCVILQDKLMANQPAQVDNPNNKVITQETIARVEFEIGETLLETPKQAEAITVMLNSAAKLPDKERFEKLNYIKEILKKYRIQQEVKNELTDKQGEGVKDRQKTQEKKFTYKQGRAFLQGYNVSSFPCEPSQLPKSPIFEQVISNICVKSQNYKYPPKQENFLESTYLLRYTFYFKAEVSGNYSFVINDVNTSEIIIDNQLVLAYKETANSSRTSKRSFNVELDKGWHYFEIYHSRENSIIREPYSFEMFYKAPNKSEPKMLSGDDIYLQYKVS